MPARSPRNESDGLYAFFALACAVTWLLAIPAALAWIRREAPGGGAVACAGLSAFGPLVAAVLVARRRGSARAIFRPWRMRPGWVAAALLAPVAVRTIAVALYTTFSGQPTQWFYPPTTPEAIAALVVFPIGEEFGWRGFAHPRVVERYGLVTGSLLLGFVWGLWHLAYSVTPEAAAFDPFVFAQNMIELPLYSLILAWLFERSGRNLAVALGFHAGGHLDHLEMAPRAELGLHITHLAVVASIAAVAAVLLARKPRVVQEPNAMA